MSEIAKLYNDVMAGVEAEKLAEYENAYPVAEDMDIDADFFAKVASGDEEAVDVMNNFIEEARAEGASDDEIEAAIAEAMEEAGVEEDEQLEDDEYEVAKAAAYIEGAETALSDVLESDIAKIAGVTAEDLLEYELGSHYGAGYAETRAELDAVVEKIAEHKYQSASPAGLLMKIAKEQEKKKGMSRGAKAGLGVAGAGALGAAGLSGVGRYARGGTNPIAGARALRAAATLAKEHGKRNPVGLARGLRLVRGRAGM